MVELKYIAAKYERARAQAHIQFNYSMRDSYEVDALKEALSFIDYLHSREVAQATEDIKRAQARYDKTRKQIELKRALLRAA